MTKLIKEAKEKLGGVTDGPWCIQWPDAGGMLIVGNNEQTTVCDPYQGEPDIKFIAWSRTGVPALIEAYEELKSAFDDRVRVIELQLRDKEQQAARIKELERTVNEVIDDCYHNNDKISARKLEQVLAKLKENRDE